MHGCNPVHSITMANMVLLPGGVLIEDHVVVGHEQGCNCGVHQSFFYVEKFLLNASRSMQDAKQLLRTDFKGSLKAVGYSLLNAVFHGSAAIKMIEEYKDESMENWNLKCKPFNVVSDLIITSCMLSICSLENIAKQLSLDKIVYAETQSLNRVDITCHSDHVLAWGLMGFRIATASAYRQVCLKTDIDSSSSKAIQHSINKAASIVPENINLSHKEASSYSNSFQDMIYDFLVNKEIMENIISQLAEFVFDADTFLADQTLVPNVKNMIEFVKECAEAWITESTIYQTEQI